MARKKKRVLGRWQKRGIFAVCLIVGLAAGFGVGYLVQKEVKHTKASSSSTKTVKKVKTSAGTTPSSIPGLTPSMTSSSSAASTPASTSTPLSSTPINPATTSLTTWPTPARAMQEYLRDRGISTSGVTFSVVKVSQVDPEWKLDRASGAGNGPAYFLLHRTGAGWSAVDYGTVFTAAQLQVDGAPADLLTP